MLYQITDGTVSLSGETVLSHIDFELKGTEKIAIVGPNGCGKSTLLKLIAGRLSLDRDDKSGGGIRSARRLTFGYLPQNVFEAERDAKPAGVLETAHEAQPAGIPMSEHETQPAGVPMSDHEMQPAGIPRDGATDSVLSKTVEQLIMSACPCDDVWDQERFLYEQEYDRMFTAFGFSKEDKTRKLREFSGGQQVRIALIGRLLERPDVLLLDEPTNHLDQEMTEWLEQWISRYDKAVIMVSHDRYFMDETADVIYEISRKKLHRYVGNYSDYVVQKQKNAVIRKKEWERQQEEIKKLEDLIRKFKNKPRKAAFARSRQKILERMDMMEKPSDLVIRPDFGKLVPENAGGKRVLETDHLVIGYDQEKPLRELNLQIRRGQKIGIIGPNGIGKTTFLKTIAGEIPALTGRYALGQHIEAQYYDQQVSLDNEHMTVLAHMQREFPMLSEKEARAALSRWGLRGKEAGRPVNTLSGGEKSKLRFAELFMHCPNFLILDEPANHLDMSAREVLESALRAYQGTVLFVSHDRYFTDQVATGLLIFEREQDQAVYYPFGYRHYAKHYHKSQTHLRAEDIALVEDFRKVPEKERGMLREISTESAYVDWQFGLIEEEMAPVVRKIREMEAELQSLDEEMNRLEWQQAMEDWNMADGGAGREMTEGEAGREMTEGGADWNMAEGKAGREMTEAESGQKVTETGDRRNMTEGKAGIISGKIGQIEQQLAVYYDKYTEYCIRFDKVLFDDEEEAQ